MTPSPTPLRLGISKKPDLQAAYGTDDLSEVEQMLMFWRHEATKDMALEIADRNRERSINRRKA